MMRTNASVWMPKRTLVLFCLSAFYVCAPAVRAGEAAAVRTIEERLAELEQRQKALETQLEAERKKSAAFEQALARTQQELASLKSNPAVPALRPEPEQTQTAFAAAEQTQIEQIVDQRLEAKRSEFVVPEWVRNVRLFGDFRYRYEYTDDQTKTADRNRNRIQTRIGLIGIINDEISYGFRLASGNSEAPLNEGSPTSNNQDLSNAFSSKNIWLDLAYFDYHPARIEGFNVLGGKIENPVYRAGNSDLIFDTDVTPEGIAAVYKTQLSNSAELFGSAGGFSVQERQTEADTGLWMLQGGGIWRFGPEKGSYLVAGAGYYNYGNLKGQVGLGKDETQFYGNTAVDGVFASDFDLVQGFAEIGTPVAGLPVRVFADAVKNVRAESDKDSAYLAGAGFGKTSTPGTWSFFYNYRDLEADSLVGVFTDGTFGGGGTNVSGHKLTFVYQLAENTQMGLTYGDSERTRGGSTTDFDFVYADFMIKF